MAAMHQVLVHFAVMFIVSSCVPPPVQPARPNDAATTPDAVPAPREPTPAVAVAALPELIVPANEARDIAASRWEYSRVHIGAGATLRVTGGSKDALHLVVRGPFVLHGKIVARESNSEARQVTLAIPKKPPVVLTYQTQNRGGTGGSGGAGGGVAGGTGAAGSVDGGGGGASGGGRFQQRPRPYVQLFPGRNASGIEGAPWSGANCGSPGGRGGERSVNGAGGVVYLEVYGDFDAANGVVDVAGSTGSPGANGGAAFFPNSSYGCQSGGGGGGGGGAGGQGGFVVGYIAGNIVAYPRVETAGGSGGAGGLGVGPSHMIGGAGTRGQSGSSGTVAWYQAETP